MSKVSVSISEEEITQDPEAADNDTGALLAGKFKTPDDLVKAYKELESKLGAPKPEADEVVTTEEKPAADAPARTDGTIDTSKPAEAKPEEKAFTLAEVAEELSESGEISKETYEKLEAKGLSKSDVDTWAEGIKARGAVLANDLRAAAGGEKEFNALLEWARTGLEADEIQAYNDAVAGGNPTVAKMLLRSMRAAYESKNGRDPKLVGGDNVPASGGVQPFASVEQMTNAMGDVRYREDPQYRKKVDQRVLVTEF